MKKILLATTLLAATAGYASAEVAVSGSARMGVIYSRVGVVAAKPATAATAFALATPAVAANAGKMQAQFSSRVRIGFAGSGTTDGGLTFGASMRADQSGQGNTANGDSTVNISGSFGSLTMGDTGNAADDIVGQVSGIGYGSGALDGAADVGFNDATKTSTGVYYKYTAGSFTVGIGSGQVAAAADYKSIAVGYTMGAYSVALGYEDDSADTMVSAKGTAAFGPATVKVKVAQSTDVKKPDLAYALSVDYAMGAATITGFYSDDNAVDANMGLGVAYDLGGGASVKGGIGSVGGDTVADLGVNLSF